MKGGTAQASHAHADQGSFVLDALGERLHSIAGTESAVPHCTVEVWIMV
jgi:hypothetical protein